MEGGDLFTHDWTDIGRDPFYSHTINISGSQKVYIGWLDLRPGDYRKYGYPSREEWQKDINDLNGSLQKFVRDYMKDCNVSGVAQNNDKMPPNGFVIQFSNVNIDPQNSIVADIAIKDASTGRLLKKFSSYGTSFHMSYSMYSLAGRLNNACYALAYEIYMQMTE